MNLYLRSKTNVHLNGLVLLVNVFLFAMLPSGGHHSHTRVSYAEEIEFEARLDTFFQQKMEKCNIPGLAFVMVQDGEVKMLKGYDLAAAKTGETISPEYSIFRLASISKVFTAAALMQLVENGEVDLYEDINTYLEDFQIPETFDDPITPYHLLTHTSGFEDQDIGFLVHDAADMVSLAAYAEERIPVRRFPPGKVMNYSNYGMVLAGCIIEAEAGSPLTAYMQEHIFDSLGMTRSTFLPTAPVLGAEDQKVEGYVYQQSKFVPVDPVFPRGGVSPEGGMRSSAGDMAKFMLAMLGDGQLNGVPILKPETADAMLSTEFSFHDLLPGMGYGFQERFENGQRVYYHDGDTEGFGSELVLVPEHRFGYFVVYNRHGVSLRSELAHLIFDEKFPGQPEQLVEDRVNTDIDLSIFVGSYRGVRYSESQPSKLIVLTESSAEVDALPNGNLRISYFGLLNGQGGAWEFTPHASNIFRNITGDTREHFYPGDYVAFSENDSGQISFMNTAGNVSLEKVNTLESNTYQVYFLLTVLIIFASISLFQPIAWVIRKMRKRHTSIAATDNTPFLIWILSIVNVIFLVLFIPQLLEIKFGISSLIALALILPYFSVVLTIVVIVRAVKFWQRRERLRTSLWVTGSGVISALFVIWMQYWNLLW